MSIKTFGQGVWHRFFGHPEDQITGVIGERTGVEHHTYGLSFPFHLRYARFACAGCKRHFWKALG